MPLQAIMHRDGYTIREDILVMDKQTISRSREQFAYYKKAGIITAEKYEDMQWIISNEVIKGTALNYQIDEVHFARITAQKLNCTLMQYQQAMRIVVTSRLGCSIPTLQNDMIIMRNFADSLTVPTDYASAQLLADLLFLLPGESIYRMEVMDQIDDVSPLLIRKKHQRKLAHYQSYLRLSDILQKFWATATEKERIFFFPTWYWYNITGVLPLRPTECVLTPRNCIRKEQNQFYITVRRTRLKCKRQSSKYNIASDYVAKEYPIPEHLARTILDYISATQNVYESDIDVLFCKSSQFLNTLPSCENDHHYTYSNLRQCLSYFYRDIIAKKYGYNIVSDHDNLMDYEIEKISLGDTRHIAMISLAISGSSPTICKELAGHDSIVVSAHYYTNLTEFLDVLGYERYREIKSTMTKAYSASISTCYPVEKGYCQCEQVWSGDYSPCVSAVNTDGIPGSCTICKWYMPRSSSLSIQLPANCNSQIDTNTPKQQISIELQQTCTMLRQAIDQLRQGLGNADTVSCILDRLAAQARQYVYTSSAEYLIEKGSEL